MNTRGLCNRRRKGDILSIDKRKSLTIDCYRAADWVAPDGKPFCRRRVTIKDFTLRSSGDIELNWLGYSGGHVPISGISGHPILIFPPACHGNR